MTPGRIIAFSIAVASILSLFFSGWRLAVRISDWNEANPRRMYYALRTDQERIVFAERLAAFEPELDDRGEGLIRVRFGDPERPSDAETLEIPVELAQPHSLPGLDRYMEWMQVFFFAEDTERAGVDVFRERVRSGDARLAVVVRRVDPGVDGENGKLGAALGLDVERDEWGWGEVMRHRWTFTFHELRRDGTIETHTQRMPESGRSFYRRQVRASQRGEPIPTREPGGLQEGSWEWDLALRLMPRPPAITHEKQALLAAGWTLPTAAASAIVALLSVAFGFAPERRQAVQAPIER